MSTTIQLPDNLVREVKARTAGNGRELDETVADLVRIGLTTVPPAIATPTSAKPRIQTDPNGGFPIICADGNAPAVRMTTEELLALEHEALLQEDLERLGLPH